MTTARLTDEEYAFVTNAVPIVCIDLIPVRQQDGQWQVGAIIRATGSQTGKVALIGGRVQHGEHLDQAIARHLAEDLQVTDYSFHPGNEVSRPFYVQQYDHAATSEPPYGFDPSKHSIGLTYLIQLGSEPKPRNEASAFTWIGQADIPADAAYNQHLTLLAAMHFLQTNNAIKSTT